MSTYGDEIRGAVSAATTAPSPPAAGAKQASKQARPKVAAEQRAQLYAGLRQTRMMPTRRRLQRCGWASQCRTGSRNHLGRGLDDYLRAEGAEQCQHSHSEEIVPRLDLRMPHDRRRATGNIATGEKIPPSLDARAKHALHPRFIPSQRAV